MDEQAYYKTAEDAEEVAGCLQWECAFSICQHETCWMQLANAQGVRVWL